MASLDTHPLVPVRHLRLLVHFHLFSTIYHRFRVLCLLLHLVCESHVRGSDQGCQIVHCCSPQDSWHETLAPSPRTQIHLLANRQRSCSDLHIDCLFVSILKRYCLAHTHTCLNCCHRLFDDRCPLLQSPGQNWSHLLSPGQHTMDNLRFDRRCVREHRCTDLLLHLRHLWIPQMAHRPTL